MDEESIFFAALQRKTPDEQMRFLDQACQGSLVLRKAVEALLEAHQQTGLALSSTTLLETDLDDGGSTIGPYRLRERLGEGGMGTVYVAEQERPVRRKVALKVVKLGMDTRQVVARFEAERQALALMEHPFIAKVLDAGATATGRPYFVMELVRGVPITDYCEHVHLAARERLRLFVDVCQAVQHAHQKGIIHRDLKPSNVLVAEVDGRPVPKVIDFGIAKATGQQLTEHSVCTAHAQLIGTPLYMSPEQLALSGVDVDTRSDVYSLGVMLYELLTGTTPVSRELLSQISDEELRRIIREEAPPLPSARISTLNAKRAATVVGGRHMDAARLSRELRGELDWIVMRALEKDRNRRYESASALAADVERYLNDEPVLACPPSLRYRAVKYARKYKVFLTSAGLVGVALLAGLIAALWQAGRANEARQIAEERERDEASARKQAEQETLRARTSFEIARQAVARMLTRVAADHISAIPGMKDVREQLLSDAVTLYTDLLVLQPGDAQTHRQRGQVHTMLRAYDQAIADYQKAIEIDPADYDSHLALSELHFVRPESQFRNIEAAIALADRAIALQPENPRGHLRRVKILIANKQKEEALKSLQRFEELTPESVEKYREIGLVHSQFGDREAGIVAARKALEINPNDAHAYKAIGINLAILGRDDEALEAIDLALAMKPKIEYERSFLYVLEERTEVYLRQQNYKAALADTTRVIELHPERSFAYKRRAVAHFHLGRPAAALADLRRALELNPKDPSSLTWIPAPEAATHTDPAYREDYLKLADETVERSGQLTEAVEGRAAIREAFLGPAAALPDLRLLLERDPSRYGPRYQAAVLAVLSSDDPGPYRQACLEIVQQLGKTPDRHAVKFAAWTCLLAPGGLDDYGPLIAMARRDIEAAADDSEAHGRLGALQFRAGQPEVALAALQKARELSDHDSSSRAAFEYLFALTESRLNRHQEAKTTFFEANKLAERELAASDSGPDRQVLERLRREAESQLDADSQRSKE